MNHFFLDIIGDIVPESIIHLLARSEIASHVIKR